MAAPDFRLEVSQNRYLSTEDDAMDAILRVTAGDIAACGSAEAAQVILLDCSGSMSVPPTKIAAARRASAAAVDALRDGTYFAIVEGTHGAAICYPRTPGMAVADAGTKAEAKSWIAGLAASGGTAMGTWLTLARELFQGTPAGIRHAVLLTDGQNHETSEELDRVLAACNGHFFCDARGIGADWNPTELRRIVTALRGTADAVRAEADLVDDFRALAEAAMAKVVPDLRIRVTTMQGAELRLLKQAYPTELDFTGNPARQPETVDGRTTWEFTTGSWAANESRDYHLRLHVDRLDEDPMFDDVLQAEIEVVVQLPGADSSERCGLETVVVYWTTDLELSSQFDPQVAHYTGQAELNKAGLAGWAAYNAGKTAEAERAWGAAVRLATEFGNTEVLKRLKRVVDVIDAGRGVVRIKPDLSHVDALSAAAGSNISSQAPDGPRPGPRPGAGKPDVTCPKCERTLSGTARFCSRCGTPLGEPR